MLTKNRMRILPFTIIAFTLLIIALAFLGTGCLPARAAVEPGAGEQPTPTIEIPTVEPGEGKPVSGGRAYVDSVEIQLLESFPLQAQAILNGNLSDGCTTIDEIRQERTDNTIALTVVTARPEDAMCTQALVPFTETVSLDIHGLSAGTYTVNVNGQTASFSLASDNVLSE